MSIIDPSGRLTETITVKRVTSHSAFGDPVRGTTLVVPARIQRIDTDANDNDGRIKLSDAKVFTQVEIELDDLLFFPEDNTSDDNTGRVAKHVEQRRALDGTVVLYSVTC